LNIEQRSVNDSNTAVMQWPLTTYILTRQSLATC